MERYFNTEGICEQELHYMVRLDDRLKEIRRKFVDPGKYFIINRGRQYGKTTMLYALEQYLKDDYFVVSMDFQGISTAEYRDEFTFTKAFMRMFAEASGESLAQTGYETALRRLECQEQTTIGEMFYLLSGICKSAQKPIILMIDEVDYACNNQVFIDFLAVLWSYYLKRKSKAVFHSVILAGVYDIKNLRLKLRPEAEHQYNSPWNIAADFDIDMSFSAEQIAVMLSEYEADHAVGMDVKEMAEKIYSCTSGYPYLVSAICKLMDEKLPEVFPEADGRRIWSQEGIAEAVKILLKTRLPLFESMTRQLDEYQDLRQVMEEIIYQGKTIPFSPYVKSISLGVMFGYLRDDHGRLAVANRIFEMQLLNMLIAGEVAASEMFHRGECDGPQFIKDARLDMELVLEKFVTYFHEIYGDNDDTFIEKYGRKFFLLFLKPIINGTGNYYLEAQTLDAGRTDVIVDYAGEQFIVEMKIWRGNEYNERGKKQLLGYLDYFGQKKGYMLSFNFNRKKEIGVKRVVIDGKMIVEAVV